jgi:prepilin-type N-terminal cleavage/methylation domain-containing protein
LIICTDKKAQGFTLLEVLVAMTIVGLGVVTLLQIFSLGLRLGTRSSARTEAVTYGARVMDELLARKKLPEGSESGRLGTDGRWQAQTQVVRESTSAFSLSSQWELKEVALEIIVVDGGRERSIEFKTLRLARKSTDP